MKLPNGWASTQFSFRFLNETINRWSLTPLIFLFVAGSDTISLFVRDRCKAANDFEWMMAA